MAQPTFAPLGSYWNYWHQSHNGGVTGPWTIRVVQDTIVNGVQTKTLWKYWDEQGFYPICPYSSHGSSEFGKLTFVNDSVIFNDRLLFSFIMQIGDTLHIDIQHEVQGDSIIAVVDTTYMTMVDSLSLRKWQLTKYWYGEPCGYATIIEDIGLVDDFILWNWEGCLLGGGCGPGGAYFDCYSSSELSYGGNCEPLLLGSGESRTKSNVLQVFPNPVTTSGVLLLVAHAPDEISLELLSTDGRSFPMDYSIFGSQVTLHRSNLPAGIYFCNITAGGASIGTARIAVVD